MRGQSGVVVGFLDQVFSTGPLPVEADQNIDCRIHVGDKDAVAVCRRVEQLVLLGFARLGSLLLHVAKSYESIAFPPSVRLVTELTLAIPISARGSGPAPCLHLLHHARG